MSNESVIKTTGLWAILTSHVEQEDVGYFPPIERCVPVDFLLVEAGRITPLILTHKGYVDASEVTGFSGFIKKDSKPTEEDIAAVQWHGNPYEGYAALMEADPFFKAVQENPVT